MKWFRALFNCLLYAVFILGRRAFGGTYIILERQTNGKLKIFSLAYSLFVKFYFLIRIDKNVIAVLCEHENKEQPRNYCIGNQRH